MIPAYVAFEGIDGSGKDTQIALLARRLEREGITPIVLHEPSFGIHGRRIRAGLATITSDIDEQRALFTADRLDHVATKIAPALAFVRSNSGFVILQNRSVLSAAAYQPRGEGDDALLATIEAELRTAPMPEAIILLDVPYNVALRRIEGGGNCDALERPKTLAAARERYRRLCRLIPACHLIEANDDPVNVAARVYAVLGGRD